MGSGFRTFASGEVLTAANVNDYLMEQAVMSFADSTARDAAVTTPEEGMTAYLQDTNSITVYSGSAWVTIADLEVLVVDSGNARVGINTPSPSNPLHISTASGSSFIQQTNGTTTTYVGPDSANTGLFGTSTNHNARLMTNNTVRVDITNAGNFVVSSGVIQSIGTYNNTTGSSANMHITSGGYFYRSTASSIRYKTDVETLEDEYADAILGLRPVWYRSLCEVDPDEWGYWGFIAEEVAEIDPRLVTFGVADDYEWELDENGQKIEPPASALTVPEGVQYDRLVPHLVNLLARQRDQIADLTARIEALENR